MSDENNKIIYEYINSHIKHNSYIKYLPFVFFNKNDLNIGLYILLEKNIVVKNIKKTKNDIISCRHFPYKCDEIKNNEHFRKEESSYSCLCKGKCQCKKSTPIYRSYIDYNNNNIQSNYFYMCDEKCCNLINIKTRYIVYI